MSSQSYSGDITVGNRADDAVEIVGPENVHLVSGAVDGDIRIVDPEHVFMATEGDTESVSIDTVGETIEGTIEDVYTEPESVAGDLLIESAADVFVQPGAATGSIEIRGHEQLFADIDEHSLGREMAATTLTGWERSTTLAAPTATLGVTGGRCHLAVEQLQTNIDVFVTGWNNSVEITGRDCTVTLHVIGSHNTVTVGPYVSVTRGIDASLETTLTAEDVPYADIIETTKNEALDTAGFGRRKLVYQVPAPEEEHCPSCGASSDRVIERKQLDALFLFGRPVYTFERGGSAYECGDCSMNAHPDVALSEDERKRLLR